MTQAINAIRRKPLAATLLGILLLAGIISSVCFFAQQNAEAGCNSPDGTRVDLTGNFTVDPDADHICVGTEVTYTVTITSDTLGHVYFWELKDSGDNVVATGGESTFTYTYNVPDEYTLDVVVQARPYTDPETGITDPQSTCEINHTFTVTVVEVQKIVVDTTSEEGPIFIPVGDEDIDLRAIPNPGTAFPDESPDWTTVEKPDAASVDDDNPGNADGTDLLQLTDADLDATGKYVFEAACGTSSKTFTLYVVNLDVDIDSDNTAPLADPERNEAEEAIEHLSDLPAHPGKFVIASSIDEDKDLFPDRADGFDLFPDETDDDITNTSFVPVVIELAGFPDDVRKTLEVTITYSDSDPAAVTRTGDRPDYEYTYPSGHMRLWLTDGSSPRNKLSVTLGGDYIPADTFTGEDLGFVDGVETITVYLEGILPGSKPADQEIEVSVALPATPKPNTTIDPLEDLVVVTVLKLDMDADSDNDWDKLKKPSESEGLTCEDNVEEDTPGCAVGRGNYDSDGDGTDDCEESSLSDTEEKRLAVMSILDINNDTDNSYLKWTVHFNDSSSTDQRIRVWEKFGTTYTLLDDGDELQKPSVGTPFKLYVEGVDVDSDDVTVKMFWDLGVTPPPGSPTPTPLSEDIVMMTVYPVPLPEAITDYFTPRQVEAPPYHMCKMDIKMPPPGSEDAGPNPFDIAFLVKDPDKTWDDPRFFEYGIEYSTGNGKADRKVYSQQYFYTVSGLYTSGNFYRLNWDGRKSPDVDTLDIEQDEDGYEIWADRPGDTSDDETYDAKPATVVNKRHLARFDYVTTRTCPMPKDPAKGALFGRPSYWRFYRGRVNSLYQTPSTVQSIAVKRGAGPLPSFTWYFNGNSWRYTGLGYGWTHNFETRIMPVRVGGGRKLYLLTGGDTLIGPADSNGEFWWEGRKVTLEEEVADKGWILNDPVAGMKYTFNAYGLLQKIKDRDQNTLTIGSSEFFDSKSDVLYRKVDSATGQAGSVSIEYNPETLDAAGCQLKKAAVGTRNVAFLYHDQVDQYGIIYPADEVLSAVNGPEYDTNLAWYGVKRKNPPSRIMIGAMKNEVVYDFDTYTPGPETTLDTLAVEPVITHLQTPEGNFQTAVTASNATYNSCTETHGYTAGTISSVQYSKNGSTTFSFSYNGNHQLVQETTPPGSTSYGYDGDGNLTSTDPSDFPATTYTYEDGTSQDPQWFVLKSINAPEGRTTTYSGFDNRGNPQTTTDPGGRNWTYTYNTNGTVATETDPASRTSTYGYNPQGMLATITRNGIELLDREFDAFGNILVAKDPEDNPAIWTYDSIDRVLTVTDALGGKETTKYFRDGVVEEFTSATGAKFTYDSAWTSCAVSGTGVNYSYTIVRDVDSNITESTEDGVTRAYTYDYADRVVEEKLAGTMVYQRTFDGAGNVKTSTDARSNTTTYDYNTAGQMTELARPGAFGGVTNTYDGAARLTSSANDGGDSMVSTTRYEYDALNRVTKYTDPRNKNTFYTYWPNKDTLKSVTDPNGNVTNYSYDADDYISQKLLPGGATVDYDTDDNGDVTTVVDTKGKSWNTPRDALRRGKGVITPKGANHTADMDSYGNIKSAQSGSLTLANTKDALGRNTKSTVNAGDIDRTFSAKGLETEESVEDLLTGIERDPSTGLPDKFKVGSIETDVTMEIDGLLRGTDKTRNYGGNVTRTREIDALGRAWKVITAAGAEFIVKANGFGLVKQVKNPVVGQIDTSYENDGSVQSINANGRITSFARDNNGNPLTIDIPGPASVTNTYNARNAPATRSMSLGAAGVRSESFTYDDALNLTSHTVAGKTRSFTYDDDGLLASLTTPDGIARSFTYNSNGQILSDSTGGASVTRAYDDSGWMTSLSISDGPYGSFTYDKDGRMKTAPSYTFDYDSDKRLDEVTDSSAALGGALKWVISPETTGYAVERTLTAGTDTLVQFKIVTNDVSGVTSVDFAPGTSSLSASSTLHEHVRPGTLARPGNAPSTTWSYNGSKEISSISHTGLSLSLGRDSDTGWVASRTRSDTGITDSYNQNNVGWITSESRSGRSIDYTYHKDGIRDTLELNGRRAEYFTSDAGALEEIRNAVLGDKLRAPVNATTYKVGTGYYATAADAVKALFVSCGATPFAKDTAIMLMEDQGAVSISPTGTLADNFDDGTGTAWTLTGTPDFAQSTIRQGDVGYAPQFDELDSASRSLADTPDALAETVKIYLDASGLADGESATLFVGTGDDATTPTILKMRLVNNSGNHQLQLLAYDSASGWISAGTVTVPLQTWKEVAFVHRLDNNDLRWWVDGTQIGTSLTIDSPGTAFADIEIGAMDVPGTSTLSVVFDDLGYGGLQPTAANPLIVRSPVDNPVTVTGQLIVGLDNVRVQGLHLASAGTTDPGVLFDSVSGAALTSCIATTGVEFRNCPSPKVVGNTFDYGAGTVSISLVDSPTALIVNNIVLNDGAQTGLLADAASSGYTEHHNCWYPFAPATLGAGSINYSPQFALNKYFTNNDASPIVSSGAVVSGFNADFNGWYRHASNPCMGAVEFEFEETVADAAGRVTTRTVAGRDYHYAYDGLGRLISYTDDQNSANSATYVYDAFGRRVKATVGNTVTRFVYDIPGQGGDDPVAEFIDQDGNGAIDTRRYYWNMPTIDQRLGFLEIDEASGDEAMYYYLTDQVGSVIAVTDDQGDVVNQYDYDAYGNLIAASSFETVPNRYRFHGREYDPERGDYYYRYRVYVPEWGLFTGPDRDIQPADPNGACNYLFCENNPLNYIDPLGLIDIDASKPIEPQLWITNEKGEKVLHPDIAYLKKLMGGLAVASDSRFYESFADALAQTRKYYSESGFYAEGGGLTGQVLVQTKEHGTFVEHETTEAYERAKKRKRMYGSISEDGLEIRARREAETRMNQITGDSKFREINKLPAPGYLVTPEQKQKLSLDRVRVTAHVHPPGSNNSPSGWRPEDTGGDFVSLSAVERVIEKRIGEDVTVFGFVAFPAYEYGNEYDDATPAQLVVYANQNGANQEIKLPIFIMNYKTRQATK